MSGIEVKGLGLVRPLFKKTPFSWTTLVLLGIGLMLCAFVFLSANISLKPKSTGQHNYIPDSATHQIVTGMESVVHVCIQEHKGKRSDKCDELADIFEVVQGSLDLAAQTSMSQSTFGLLNIGYWQYIVTGITAVFLFIAVLQTGLILKEAKDSTIAANRAADAAVSAEGALIITTVEFKARDHGMALPVIDIENYGRTPAREAEIRIFFEPFAPHGDYGPPPEPIESILHTVTVGVFPSQGKNRRIKFKAPLIRLNGWDCTASRIRVEVSYKTVFNYPDSDPVVDCLKFSPNEARPIVDVESRDWTVIRHGISTTVEPYEKGDY